jgi:transposase
MTSIPDAPVRPDVRTDVITGGVDTHRDVHVAGALDGRGAELGTRSFPTTPAGYRSLLEWLRSFGEIVRIGVEGTGAWGVGPTRFLTAEGVDVVEVDRPNRQTRRKVGKSDPLDAAAAARAALSGPASGQAKAATARWRPSGRCGWPDKRPRRIECGPSTSYGGRGHGAGWAP